MNADELKALVQEIVQEARTLKDAHTKEINAPVNYAAIFAQTKEEYEALLAAARQLGKVIQNTPTGSLFQIDPLDTVAGRLRLLKVRIPDKTRPERGDADFTVSNYPSFKKTYLPKSRFKLIEREKFEMIELRDPHFKVRAYFSHPPLDQQLGLKYE